MFLSLGCGGCGWFLGWLVVGVLCFLGFFFGIVGCWIGVGVCYGSLGLGRVWEICGFDG